jgi:ABC-type microcin C transport system permease subunit YejB
MEKRRLSSKVLYDVELFAKNFSLDKRMFSDWLEDIVNIELDDFKRDFFESEEFSDLIASKVPDHIAMKVSKLRYDLSSAIDSLSDAQSEIDDAISDLDGLKEI